MSRNAFSLPSNIFGHYADIENLVGSLIKYVIDEMIPADAGVIYVCDENNRKFLHQASYGYPWGTAGYAHSIRHGMAANCLALQKPLLLTSATSIDRYIASMDMENAAQQHKTRQGLLRVTSVAAVPLILEDKSSGVILLEHFNDHHRGFNKADIAQLSEIGKWIPLIIEYHRSELELKETKLSYRQLVGRFLETGEDERRRIAREIHDDINHVLLSVKLDLEDMARSVPEEMEKVREKLKTLHGHVSQAFDNLHRLSLNLRPQILDELGLPQALDLYVRNLSEESGLPITIEVKGLSRRRPAPVVEIELFRIAQEGLSNILKHAHASLAHIRLSFGTLNLMLEIEDDGVGFDVDAIFKDHVSMKNLGLLGMKERAEICGGKLSIFSSQGHGTKLVTTIPIASYNWGTY